MAAAALADRGRWILGSGLLATLAVVTAGIQAGDAAANAAFPYLPPARLLMLPFGVWPWSEFLHPDATRTATALSLQGGARMIGLSGWAAQILQWGFGFVALAGAAIAFVRRGPEPRSIALLLLAIVLALPGANSDLLVVAAPALTLALFAENPSGERPFLSFVPALLIWLMPVLAVPFGAIAWPGAPVVATGSMLAALARESAWKQGRDGVVPPIETWREGAP